MTSSPASPDVQAFASAVPQPTNPVADQTVTDASTTFQWAAVPDAAQFRLQIASGEDFERIYHETVVDGPSNIRLADVLPETAERIFWRVRVDDQEEASWSSPASFFVSEPGTATGGEFVVDAPPVTVRPRDGESVVPSGSTLMWEQVPEASGYRVQVGSADTFEDPIVDLTLDRTTHLTLHESLPEGKDTLYWRVRPLFSGGAEGRWSEAVRFRTELEPKEPVESTTAGPMDGDGDETSARQSPRAAGPAQTGRTSGAVAWGFISLLLVSFALTILLIMWVSS